MTFEEWWRELSLTDTKVNAKDIWEAGIKEGFDRMYRLYDILDVEFVVDALIDQSKGEYMIWDRLGIWNMYCEMRKQVHEEIKAKAVH